MAIFNRYPYTNGHELNLDWILTKIRKLPTKVSQLINDAGYLNMDTVPVKSVNGKIGDVDLNYQDVDALPGDLPIALGTHSSGTALRFNLVDSNEASGNYSFAAGMDNESTAEGSVTIGKGNKATALCAFAVGCENTASGKYSHAEGLQCEATIEEAHAEGYKCIASGVVSHTEGFKCTASGTAAHTEGRENTASGLFAHVEGAYCVGDHRCHHVFGSYNAPDPNTGATDSQNGKYIEMVGNGSSDTDRSNARTLDWDGNEILAGKLTMGSDPTDPMDAASKKYVDRSVIAYGVTDATSTATEFTATIPGVTELTNSTIILIKNNAATSASGCSLNVNNLGAKPIYNNMGNARVTNLFRINYTFLMIYDDSLDTDGAWILYMGYYQNDNNIGYQIRTQTAQAMNGNMYRYRLIFQSADGKRYVAANQSTSTGSTSSKAVTTIPINPFGPIRYYSSTTAVTNGNKPNVSYVWDQNVTEHIGYSFAPNGNVTALFVGEPVYLKCTPQTDGSAIIDPATPIVTDLPSTEDGKIYILLGLGNTTAKLELQLNHPVYQYKNGKICLYTGN